MPKPFVLIVEDERDIASLFRHVMDLAGYRTEIASNGALALERLASSRPDIVLLDLSLPRTNGAQVLKSIRSDARLNKMPVIVITAHYELAGQLDVEPDLVLMKPVSAEQLISLVNRLRRKSRRVETSPLTEEPWDSVTGLYNRSFFLHRVDSAIRSMKESGQNLFAVLSLSPGRYETIRSQYGDGSADEFLRVLASSLKGSVRPTDTLGRFEGDRFYILIEQAPGLQIPEMIAARIQNRIQDRPADTTGAGYACNIGVLLCDDRYDDAGEILRDAQLCYARAEVAGPGACLTFDHDTVKADRPPDRLVEPSPE